MQKGEVENSEFSENSETSENQFSEVFNSEFSILHYTQNGKLGVENLGDLLLVSSNLRYFGQRGFSDFSILHYTQNGKLGDENLGFSPTPSDQTPRFSISEFSVLSVVQNGKLGVGKPRSLIK